MKQRKTPIGKLVVPILILAAIILIIFYAWLSYEPNETTNPMPTHWPTTGWSSSLPEEEGFDSTKLAEGLQTIQQNQITIHSLMIVHHGNVILDAYFYPYDGSTYHDLASVTKSVMTTLIGIAADQGKLALDTPVLSFFSNRTIANVDARKENITVRHLVRMTSGFSCTAVPWEKTLEDMMASPDWIQFALDRPMASEPGARFVYDSCGMHLLSAILKQVTGMTALDFARTNLFEPLGISDVCWPSDPQGITRGWGDLCLYPHDAAKIGLLFLTHGFWENRQIVSKEWVENATMKQVSTGSYKAEDYGYGWWISREELQYFRADGANGQRILVIPSMNLVVVTTGGGFEFDEIVPSIEAAIVDVQKHLPANPTGVAQLQLILGQCTQSPPPEPVAPLPDTAQTISEKTYVFETNPIQLQSLGIDFNNSSVALFHLNLTTEEIPRVARVGLDTVYQPSIGGRPSVARGHWVDNQTFEIEYNEGPGINSYRFLLHFEGDNITFEIAGLITLEGTLEEQ